MKALFGRFDLWGDFSCIQGLEEAEEAGCFPYAAELNAKGLHLDEQVLHVDDLVPDQRLQEHTHQAHKAVLPMETERIYTDTSGTLANTVRASTNISSEQSP